MDKMVDNLEVLMLYLRKDPESFLFYSGVVSITALRLEQNGNKFDFSLSLILNYSYQIFYPFFYSIF